MAKLLNKLSSPVGLNFVQFLDEEVITQSGCFIVTLTYVPKNFCVGVESVHEYFSELNKLEFSSEVLSDKIAQDFYEQLEPQQVQVEVSQRLFGMNIIATSSMENGDN